MVHRRSSTYLSNYSTENGMSLNTLIKKNCEVGELLQCLIVMFNHVPTNQRYGMNFRTFVTKEVCTRDWISTDGRDVSTDSSNNNNSRKPHNNYSEHIDVKDWYFPESITHFNTYRPRNGKLFRIRCPKYIIRVNLDTFEYTRFVNVMKYYFRISLLLIPIVEAAYGMSTM